MLVNRAVDPVNASREGDHEEAQGEDVREWIPERASRVTEIAEAEDHHPEVVVYQIGQGAKAEDRQYQGGEQQRRAPEPPEYEKAACNPDNAGPVGRRGHDRSLKGGPWPSVHVGVGEVSAPEMRNEADRPDLDSQDSGREEVRALMEHSRR